MLNWIRRPFLIAALSLASIARAAVSTEDIAEANRLYERANAFVSNITEDGYSYAYIQFYWKRAQVNLDRINRVYPLTLVGRQLTGNEVNVGPFTPTYFRERVLPRLEEKKLAAFDGINCSIFLYNLQTENTPARLETLTRIIELLCRQQRWEEAMDVPVLDQYRPLLISTVLRIATLYENDKLVGKIIAAEDPKNRPALQPVISHALALRGEKREKIAKFLDQFPEPEVRLAVLSGMVEREIQFHFAALTNFEIKDGIQTTHFSVMHPDVRDDIESTARTFFPTATAASYALLTEFKAAKGQRPAPSAPLAAHPRYMEYLALSEKSDLLSAYPSDPKFNPETKRALDLKLIELLARTGQTDASEKARLAYAQPSTLEADQAAFAQFVGQCDSEVTPLVIRETTFSKLPISNPNIIAHAILEWSLKPNRNIRGAAPWDAVVQRFQHGFADLPLPLSKEVQRASATLKPY